MNFNKKYLGVIIAVIPLLIIGYFASLILKYKAFRTENVEVNVELAPLLGYSSKRSYSNKDSIEIFIHAESNYIGEVFRYSDSIPIKIHEFEGEKNLQAVKYSLRFGHNWKKPVKISTNKWKPGFYIIRLNMNSKEDISYNIPVLISSKSDRKIVVVSPTNTWQAYNDYGGKSNYKDYVTPKDLQYVFKWSKQISETLVPYNYLPKNRPFNHKISYANNLENLESLNGKISSDLYFISFMESYGYEYNIISDSDFEKGVGLDSAKVIIFHNHSEYWSYEAIGMLKNSIEEGKSILFLSGNNIYRQVETVKGNSLVVLNQLIPRSIVEPIIGTHYSESGYQEPFSAFKVKKDNHWIYDKTELKNGDKFGEKLISGIETDKKGPFSDDFLLLAIGTNKNGPAHMVIKEFKSGNIIFNTSSVSSVRALKVDKNWRKIVNNLIDNTISIN